MLPEKRTLSKRHLTLLKELFDVLLLTTDCMLLLGYLTCHQKLSMFSAFRPVRKMKIPLTLLRSMSTLSNELINLLFRYFAGVDAA